MEVQVKSNSRVGRQREWRRRELKSTRKNALCALQNDRAAQRRTAPNTGWLCAIPTCLPAYLLLLMPFFHPETETEVNEMGPPPVRQSLKKYLSGLVRPMIPIFDFDLFRIATYIPSIFESYVVAWQAHDVTRLGRRPVLCVLSCLASTSTSTATAAGWARGFDFLFCC